MCVLRLSTAHAELVLVQEASESLGGPSLPIESRAVLAGADPAVQVEGPVLADEAVAVLMRLSLRKP